MPKGEPIPAPVPPGALIGILGGGQLGRMLALAAARLGFDVWIYEPEPDCPAGRVAARHVCAGYDNLDALSEFAAACAVVTYEFENVPAAAAAAIAAAGTPLRPSAQALAVTQDRLLEKNFLNNMGAPTVAYRAIDADADIAPALAELGAPAILKTRRLGYDGKGQIKVAHARDAAAAFAALGGAPCILEAMAAFTSEASVIAARGLDGAFAAYDVSENEHENHVLKRSRAPARLAAPTGAEAMAMARRVAEGLDYVGVLGLELFVMPDGSLRANEVAPRVHNSGHWTPHACVVGQFEQHIRAVCGWPIGAATRLFDAEMVNLLGDAAADWRALAIDGDVRLELYGKRSARSGRKMGHYTRLFPIMNPA